MNALLLIAHGSRRQGSNDEVRALAEQLRDAGSDVGFDSVAHAFLEMAEPTIAQCCERLIAAGAERITWLPYFLAAGAHVAADIPAEAERIRGRHPRVGIVVVPHFGAAEGVAGLLCEHLVRCGGVSPTPPFCGG